MSAPSTFRRSGFDAACCLLLPVSLSLAAEPPGADMLAELPLECRVSVPAPYRLAPDARKDVLVIEWAIGPPHVSIAAYPRDPADTRDGSYQHPQFGWFVDVETDAEGLRATDSVTRRDRLRLQREGDGRWSFDLEVGSKRSAGRFQGACRQTRVATRFPFRDSRWPPPSYAEVRLYRYNVEGHGPVRIFEQGRFSESVVSSVALNREQIRRLLAATTGAHPEHPVAMCFNPRHAFVFLDSAGKPLSFAEVCFECSNYRLSNAAPNVFDMQALGRIVKEAGMPLE